MTASAVLDGGPVARTERAFPCLDGLRLVAASAVVLTHTGFSTGNYATGLGGLLGRMEIGVPIFFVLSGFLLTRPYLQAGARGGRAPRFVSYLWRRALRILPAYWLVVAAALLLLPGNADAGPVTWLRHLTLTQLYTPGWFAVGLNPTWSLCTEAAFYLVLPLAGVGLARLVRARPDRPRGALVALGIAAVVGPVRTFYFAGAGATWLPFRLWLPGYAAWFAAGMALALLTVADPSWRPARVARELGASLPTCWVAAGALFWISTGPVAGPVNLSLETTPTEAVVRNVLYLLVAALVVLPLVFGDQRRGAVRRFLSAPTMRFMGEASYGLFLVHAVLIEAAYRVFGWQEFTGSLVLVTVGIWTAGMALASLIYVLVERPLQRFRTLVPERAPGRSAATTTAASATTARV
jgi:peptidoglycan/LPS O-acetylase OafA/YrhL